MLNHTGIVDMDWLHTHGLRPLEGMTFRDQGDWQCYHYHYRYCFRYHYCYPYSLTLLHTCGLRPLEGMSFRDQGDSTFTTVILIVIVTLTLSSSHTSSYTSFDIPFLTLFLPPSFPPSLTPWCTILDHQYRWCELPMCSSTHPVIHRLTYPS